jgi:hypothetical protein
MKFAIGREEEVGASHPNAVLGGRHQEIGRGRKPQGVGGRRQPSWRRAMGGGASHPPEAEGLRVGGWGEAPAIWPRQKASRVGRGGASQPSAMRGGAGPASRPRHKVRAWPLPGRSVPDTLALWYEGRRQCG